MNKGDLVRPTDLVVKKHADLKEILASNGGAVIGRIVHVMSDKRFCPLIVQFECGKVYAFYESELEIVCKL